MPLHEPSGLIFFQGSISLGVLTPSTNFDWSNLQYNVNDDGDGNADTGTDWWFSAANPYSGYTIEINGNDYAIFSDPHGYFYIPYFDDVEDLQSFDGTTVTQTITLSGENADVVNLCFMAGTKIATPNGARVIEDLSIGDFVTTAEGKDVPVKWIGRQTIKSMAVNMSLSDKLIPVCIKAGTLGNHSDLYVTADHGMIVDGMVITAGAMVNNDTINYVPVADLPREFNVYHVETEAHDVILANGAPAETFIDYVGRSAFDNHQEYLDLYGTERIIPEMKFLRVSNQRLIPTATKARLGIIDDPQEMVLNQLAG